MAAELELAYIAGFIDGEGTITINRRWETKNHITPHYTYVPNIQIWSTNKEIVNWCQSIIGGYINVNQPNKRKTAKLVAYALRITTLKDCLQTAKTLLPYLKIKKPNARILIEFCESRLEVAKQNNRNPRKMKYTDYERNLFEEIVKYNIKRAPFVERVAK